MEELLNLIAETEDECSRLNRTLSTNLERVRRYCEDDLKRVEEGYRTSVNGLARYAADAEVAECERQAAYTKLRQLEWLLKKMKEAKGEDN